MRASPLWLSSLIVVSILFGMAFSVDADSKANEHKLTKDLYLKVNSVPPDENVKVIITFKKSKGQVGAHSAKSSVKDDIKAKGGKVKREYSIIEGMAVEIPASKVAELANNPNVLTIEYDHPVRAHINESIPLINADDVWNEILDGQNVTGIGQTVCVIDSGVNYSSSDFGGGIGDNYTVIDGYDFVNNNDTPLDDYGHGTHVTGIVASNDSTYRGVAPGAKIVALKVLDNNGSGSFSDIISAIGWCVNNASLYNISVISMSIGTWDEHYTGYCDSSYQSTAAAINSAIANNISVVVSTGNEDNYAGISSPACIQNATRVAATDKSDNFADFANRGGSFNDILAAPGVNISSSYWLNDNLISIQSGTSQAAPHVSGLIALLNQEYKSIYGTNPTPGYLLNVMKSTGVQIYDVNTSKNYPRIDALAAYNAINLYSNDLDDDGDNFDNNFTASYNTSSNTPVWNGSSNKINITDADTGEGKLISINDTGLLFDGNTDYDLKDANAGVDYTLYNGLYVVDGNAGIVQLAYEPVFNATFSNGDGDLNAGEVVMIKGSNYVITDNDTSDQNISLGAAIAMILVNTTADQSNATDINGTKKVLYSDGKLYFYNSSSAVDNVSLSGISEYPYKLNSTDITSDEFKSYSIYVISKNATTAKVTLTEKSRILNLTNGDESVFGYDSIKINDADFPKTGEIVFLSENISLVEGQYVNVPDTYYSMYFDSGKNLDIFRRNSTPPNITSGPTASVSTSSATIAWTTDEFSNSTVEYGTNTSYGTSTGSDSLVQSHSITLTGLSSSTTYHYMVLSSDFTGNSIASGDYNFTTSSAPAPVTSTGGGGPPEPKDVSKTATVTDGKATVTISKVSAEKTGTITIPEEAEVAFKEIAIKVKNTVVNMKIDIYELSSKPVDIAEDITTGTVHSYIQLDETNIEAADIDTVTIKFKVPVSWITEKNIDKTKVVLNRYGDGKWNALTTTKKSEDSSNIHYSAVSPGLSTFGVSGEVMTEPVLISAPTATTTAPVTTAPPPTVKPSAKEEEKFLGICGPSVVLLFAMLPPIVYRRRRKAP